MSSSATTHKPYGPYERFFKRPLDLFCGLLVLIVFSWLYAILIVAGCFFMKGNPFFIQERPGKNEKLFKLIKFRTMDNGHDKEGNLLPDELRLNKYGRFLRKTSLDELPEAFNIIKGDMSIIGPRPLLPRDVAYMNDVQLHRHCVRPGLTGLAQCNGRNLLNWDMKLETDLQYVDNISFVFDCKILCYTILKVIKREGIAFDDGADMDLKDWNELKRREAGKNGTGSIYTSTK